jgi:hypothetical protein
MAATNDVPFFFVMDTTKFVAMLKRMEEEVGKGTTAQPIMLVAYYLLMRIIEKTPVWTGETRGGWYKSQDYLSTQLGGAVPASPQLASAGEKYGYQHSRITTALKTRNKSVTMTNTAPQAVPLEYGWSRKAPLGMVRISIQEMYGIIPPLVLAQLKVMWANNGVPPGTRWWASMNGMSFTKYRYQAPTILDRVIHRTSAAVRTKVNLAIGGKKR